MIAPKELNFYASHSHYSDMKKVFEQLVIRIVISTPASNIPELQEMLRGLPTHQKAENFIQTVLNQLDDVYEEFKKQHQDKA